MSEFFTFAVTYLPYLLQGALVTIEIAIIGVIAGSLLGLIVGLGRVSNVFIFSQISRLYIWVVRGTPLLLQLFIIHFAIPSVFSALTMPPFVSACIALSLNAAAYIAEIARGAIQSIDKGQMEAARSLGLSYNQAMRRIIIPQAFRRMLPPLGNEFIALIKESSLVSTILIRFIANRPANYQQYVPLYGNLFLSRCHLLIINNHHDLFRRKNREKGRCI
jgi:polar amino acid transport system permease protein